MGKTVLSLFDGIACARVALERVGIDVSQYFASEVDEYAIKVANKNWPDIVQIGDITKLNTDDLPRIDLLVGGSPCQSLSTSGKQGGFGGTSGLFYEYLRVFKELRAKNPDLLFLLENVKMKKEWEEVITAEMGADPILINSSLFSAQNRQRLYWTNIPFLGLPEDRGIKLQDILESGYVDRNKSYCIDANYFKGGNLTQYFKKSRRQLVFPTQEDLDLALAGDSGAKFRKLTPVECERLQNLPDGYTNCISDTRRYHALGNGWTVYVIAHLFKNIT
jgi:site-specific DNA-cytosine methylase